MALTKASLSSRIQTNVIAALGTPADSTQLQKFADAVAQAVVDEIHSNGVVSVTGTVTSGTGAGGSVTATGTVS